jgi:hypothetical protein
MTQKSSRLNIGVSLVSISSVLAMSSAYAADASNAKPAGKSAKKAVSIAQSQSSGGGSASKSSATNVSESNAGAQIVRLGMSVETVNTVGVSNVIAFSKVMETQRASGGLNSVLNTIQACNASPQGVSFVKNVAALVNTGQSVSDLATLSSGIAKGTVSIAVVDDNLAVAKDAPAQASDFLKKCATAVQSGSTTDIEDLKKASDLYKSGASASDIANISGSSAFRQALSLSAKNAYDSLSEAQQSRFFSLYSANTSGASTVLENGFLTAKFGPMLVDTTHTYSNPLLAEAALTANSIIKDQAFSANSALSSSDALTYATMFPNGYNKALISLLAKYSNSSALADTVNTFLATKSLSMSTTLNQVFSSQAKQNTDLLGFRSLVHGSSADLNIALSQGESYLRRNINLTGGSGIQLDVTNTILKNATVAVAGQKTKADRMYAVAALGDMNVSGKVTFTNTNTNARYTRNVLVIGALNSLKVADNTQIINQGKILAVGAGKLQGASGEQIKGLKLESKGAIYVGSGKNLNLKDVTFTVGNTKNSLNMYAQNTMTVDNASFSGFGGSSKIYMEATTVDLSNLSFPNGSKVTLASRDGGTANGTSGTGRYPHFGSSAAGRVNFIQNVSYNGSPLTNTAQFDTAGTNITIKSYNR